LWCYYFIDSAIAKLTIHKEYRSFIDKGSLNSSIRTSPLLLTKLKLIFKDVTNDFTELINSYYDLMYNLEEFVWRDIHNEIISTMNRRN